MVRFGVGALALALLFGFPGSAHGQTASYDIGTRTIGQTHSLALTARNQNCPQALDFRFDFAPSPWLRPQGGTIVRGVLQGQSRPLPAIVDLTRMPAGRHTATINVVCANCEAIDAQACRFDRQQLTISVEAVAQPAPASAATAPASTAAPVSPPPRTARPTPAPPSAPPADPQPDAPAPVQASDAPPPVETPASAPPSNEAAAACDCAGENNALGAIAAIAALAAIGFGAVAFNAMRAAHAARSVAPPGDNPQPPQDERVRALLQDRARELEELNINCRRALTGLMRQQLLAIRALSSLGLLSAEQAAEVETWRRTGQDAGFGIAESGDDIVAGAGSPSLPGSLETLRGVRHADQAIFTTFAGSSETHGQRLGWLQTQGLASDQASAQGVLNEMMSFLAHGASMSGMIDRLREEADECRRADAELAAALAQAAAG